MFCRMRMSVGNSTTVFSGMRLSRNAAWRHSGGDGGAVALRPSRGFGATSPPAGSRPRRGAGRYCCTLTCRTRPDRL
jgi:hypothetical protein